MSIQLQRYLSLSKNVFEVVGENTAVVIIALKLRALFIDLAVAILAYLFSREICRLFWTNVSCRGCILFGNAERPWVDVRS